MNDNNSHIDPQNVPESPASLFMRGIAGMMQERDAELYQMQQRCNRLEAEVEAKAIEPTPIVADGRQKKLVAILNAIYEAGYISDCIKKDYMQRMATALGCPSIADYAKALYNVKNTYQYEEIFEELSKVAKDSILKNS